MANEFWLSDRQWAVLEPLIPMRRRGVKPKRNREIINGIVHISKVGCRWRDCPEVYGPQTAIYNRFNRWSRDGIWQTMLGSAGGSRIRWNTKHRQHRLQGTSLRRRGKRGRARAGNRSQPRRADDQDPCRRQRVRPSDRLRRHRWADGRCSPSARPHREAAEGSPDAGRHSP